jgi:hypothetical protein
MKISPLFPVVAMLLLAAPIQAQFVPKGSDWKYLDDGSDQGAAWQAPGFDDSAWASGPAVLGYGNSDVVTVVDYGPDEGNKYPTTYFRHRFNISNPGSVSYLTASLRRDDGAIVYLNGTEVISSNMPDGAINYLSFAGSTVSGEEEDTFFRWPLDPSLLVAGTNVLAVEIHQRKGSSSDIIFDFELSDVPLPPVERTPYLQNATPNSMVVRWRTHYEFDSLIRWGDSPSNLNHSMSSATPSRDHEFEITGLDPDTLYYYSVGDSTTTFAGADANHFFRTFPDPGPPRSTRIWVLGDSGTADANAELVRDSYYSYTASTPTDLWLMLGDNAYSIGSFEEYQAAVFDMYPEMLRSSPLYATRGNHDDSGSDFYGQFTFPTAGEAGGLPSGSEAYYSFDYANIHFVCMDSDSTSRKVNDPMLTWLEADLASTDQDWIIAFWHHPPYSKGVHDSDDPSASGGRMLDMRENALPILEDYGVDLVLCGHSHSYERSFLIDGHYGDSTTFDPNTMLIDGGNGRDGSDTGAYAKTMEPHQGTVYVVAGSSGKTETGTLDHPVMFKSIEQLGSVVLDVNDKRIDLSFLRGTGVVRDWFTLHTREFGPSLSIANLIAGQQATITVSSATPGNNILVGWSLTGAGPTPTPYGDVMLSPQINQLGPIAADAMGNVVLPVNLPIAFSGVPVWAQALEITGAGSGWLSNPLAVTIQ